MCAISKFATEDDKSNSPIDMILSMIMLIGCWLIGFGILNGMALFNGCYR